MNRRARRTEFATAARTAWANAQPIRCRPDGEPAGLDAVADGGRFVLVGQTGDRTLRFALDFTAACRFMARALAAMEQIAPPTDELNAETEAMLAESQAAMIARATSE